MPFCARLSAACGQHHHNARARQRLDRQPTPSMRWFWLVLHLATAEHVISPHQNGEEICENKGFDPSECAAVGCCHYNVNDGQCRSAVGTGPCSRRVLQSYGPASVAGTVVASTGIESRSDGLLLYMLVITYYPFIVALAVVGMLVGCLAPRAARAGRHKRRKADCAALGIRRRGRVRSLAWCVAGGNRYHQHPTSQLTIGVMRGFVTGLRATSASIHVA